MKLKANWLGRQWFPSAKFIVRELKNSGRGSTRRQDTKWFPMSLRSYKRSTCHWPSRSWPGRGRRTESPTTWTPFDCTNRDCSTLTSSWDVRGGGRGDIIEENYHLVILQMKSTARSSRRRSSRDERSTRSEWTFWGRDCIWTELNCPTNDIPLCLYNHSCKFCKSEGGGRRK